MNIKRTTFELEKYLDTKLVYVIEMPLMELEATNGLRHVVIINVGPLEIDLTDPSIALEASIACVKKILSFFQGKKQYAMCRFGVSIFVPPGDQGGRILSGSFETGKLVKQSGEKLQLENVYSNIRSIIPLIENCEIISS